MIKKKDDTISLKLDSPNIPFKEFLSSVRDFFDVIKELTEEFYGSKRAIKWLARAREGCAVIEAVPVPTNDPRIKPSRISKAFVTGVRTIEKGKRRPPHFSEKALEKVKSLAGLTNSNKLNICIQSGKDQQKISSKAKANIENLLSCTHFGIGTVEGQLRILAKRKSLEIEIFDEVSMRQIHCFIPAEMLEDAKEAFDRRVSVTGRIHYRANGTPVNIEVNELFRFPFNRELPSHRDVRGIFGAGN